MQRYKAALRISSFFLLLSFLSLRHNKGGRFRVGEKRGVLKKKKAAETVGGKKSTCTYEHTQPRTGVCVVVERCKK